MAGLHGCLWFILATSIQQAPTPHAIGLPGGVSAPIPANTYVPPPGSVIQASAVVPAAVVQRNVFLRQYDLNGDNRLAPNEVPQRFVKKFAIADLNQDGFLDSRELLFGQNPIAKKARKDEHMKLDREGHLIDKGRGADGDVLYVNAVVESLRRFDVNHDGVIDANEMAAALRDPTPVLAPAAQQQLPMVVGQPTPAIQPATPMVLADAGTPVVPAAPPGALPTTSGGASAVPHPRVIDDSIPQNSTAIPATPSPEVAAAPANVAPPTYTPMTAAPRAAAVQPPTAAAPPQMPTGFNASPARSSPIGPDGLPTAEAIMQALDKNHNGKVDRNEAVDRLAENFNRLDRDHDGGLTIDEIDRGLRLARMFGIKPKMNLAN